MGALRGNMTYLRYAVAGDPPDGYGPTFEQAIEARRFLPLGLEGDTQETSGWVPVIAPFHDELPISASFFIFDHRIILTYREDTIVIPSPLFKAKVSERVADWAEESGETPSRTTVQAIREAVHGELRRRVLPRTKLVDVVWDLHRKEVRFFGRGKTLLERLEGLFERTFSVAINPNTFGQRAFGADLGLRAQGVLESLAPQPAFTPATLKTSEETHASG